MVRPSAAAPAAPPAASASAACTPVPVTVPAISPSADSTAEHLPAQACEQPPDLPLRVRPPEGGEKTWGGPAFSQERLLQAARQARQQAYAPYSRFAVGAAVLDEHGRIHAGCNIENAAYPQSQCAEASAIAHLVLAGGRRIVAAAVVGEADSPVTPCGGCRQRLREFAADDCPVWVGDASGLRASYTLGQLLPASFGPQHLLP